MNPNQLFSDGMLHETKLPPPPKKKKKKNTTDIIR